MGRKIFVIPVFVAFAAIQVQAEGLPNNHRLNTVYTTADFGRGSSGVATSDINTGVFHNPASVGMMKVYSFEGGYIQAGNGFSLSLADGTNPYVSGGIGYVQMEGESGETIRQVPVSAGKQISDRLSLGMRTTYNQIGDATAWTFGAGMTVLLSPEAMTAVSVENIIGADEPFRGRSVVWGFMYQLPLPLMINFQVSRDFNRTETLGWGGGATATLPYGIVATGGVRQTGYEGLRGYWSAGLGYLTKGFRVSGAYERALKEPQHQALFLALTYWK